MVRFFWIISGIAAFLGSISFFVVLLDRNINAPQQAAAAGMILAFVIPPYIFARAFSEDERLRLLKKNS